MLTYYRNRAGLTPEQLGGQVYLSGSQIRKVENGNRTLTPELAKACENIPELGCNGALTELLGLLGDQLKRRPFPGWFEGWPEKEAQAKRLRTFQPLVVPGLLQTEVNIQAPSLAAAVSDGWLRFGGRRGVATVACVVSGMISGCDRYAAVRGSA